MPKALTTTRSHAQPAWVLRSSSVQCTITRSGGHMAPVIFGTDSQHPIEPYYISPWQDERMPTDEPVLGPLRGDFFCMPFGGNPQFRGEDHRVHGEVAYAKWKKESFTETDEIKTLTLTMSPTVRKGEVIKRLFLREGENVVYLQHELRGFTGKIPLGHHAILAPPEKGQLHISTSPLQFGQTSPRPAEYTAGKEYYSLASNARFKSLKRVPTIWKDKPFTDASVFPAREGFIDILSIYAKLGKKPAWTCAVAPQGGYLWFSLKDANVLPSTTMWTEYQGRHNEPWAGRNCCIGLEDVCAYHTEGLKASVQANDISKEGIPTCIELSKRTPTFINYIQGAVRIPRRFDRVQKLRFSPGEIEFTAHSGACVKAPVAHEFLTQGSFDA